MLDIYDHTYRQLVWTYTPRHICVHSCIYSLFAVRSLAHKHLHENTNDNLTKWISENMIETLAVLCVIHEKVSKGHWNLCYLNSVVIEHMQMLCVWTIIMHDQNTSLQPEIDRVREISKGKQAKKLLVIVSIIRIFFVWVFQYFSVNVCTVIPEFNNML